MKEQEKISPSKRRKLLVQLFYRYLLMNNNLSDIEQDLLDETQASLDEKTFEIAKKIAKDLPNLIKRVKPLLVKDWKWERIPALTKSILVVGTFEISETETPKAVVTNELTELAKELGLESEYQFINAILDKIDKI